MAKSLDFSDIPYADGEDSDEDEEEQWERLKQETGEAMGAEYSGDILNADDLGTETKDQREEEQEMRRKDMLGRSAREMMVSERNFIESLEIVAHFKNHVEEAKRRNKHLSYPEGMKRCVDLIVKLKNLNQVLLEKIQPRLNTWEQDPRIADVFVESGPFLKTYRQYIQYFTDWSAESEQVLKKYPLFAQTLKEFEESSICQGLSYCQSGPALTMANHMLRPIQRMPQYRLMLENYKKYLLEGSEEYENTTRAIEIMIAVSNGANEGMGPDDKIQKLIDVNKLITGDFNVLVAGREFLRRGDFETQTRGKWKKRTLFLFNNCLLVTAPTLSGKFRTEDVLTIVDLKVTRNVRADVQTIFNIGTTKTSISVAASSLEEKDDWVNTFEETIREAIRKRNSLRRPTGVCDYQRDQLGEASPAWTSIDIISMCMLCTAPFGAFNRRDHCRACGKIVCKSCLCCEAPLHYCDYDAKEVCNPCFDSIYDKMMVDTNSDLTLSIHFDKFKKGTPKPNPQKPKITALRQVRATDVGEISGYLSSRPESKTRWKRHWFVLKDNVLYKFKASADVEAKETRIMLGFTVTAVTNVGIRVVKMQQSVIEPVIYKADTPEDTKRWLQKMKESTVLSTE